MKNATSQVVPGRIIKAINNGFGKGAVITELNKQQVTMKVDIMAILLKNLMSQS